MMEKINCVGLFVLVMFQVVSASDLNFTINKFMCGFDYTVKKADVRIIRVHWDGRILDEGCALTFKLGGFVDEACMETIERDLPDCLPKVRFYRGYSIIHAKELDCNSGHIKFCSEGNDRISIQFHNAYWTTASNVRLKVYGVSRDGDDDDDDGDYLYLIRPIASAVGGVLIVIGVAVGWCICLKINRKKERQRKEMLAANPPKTWAQQAQEQQAQGYTYNTQQNTMYPVVPPIGTAPPYPADGKMAPY